jgi:hypothetical protein
LESLNVWRDYPIMLWMIEEAASAAALTRIPAARRPARC